MLQRCAARKPVLAASPSLAIPTPKPPGPQSHLQEQSSRMLRKPRGPVFDIGGPYSCRSQANLLHKTPSGSDGFLFDLELSLHSGKLLRVASSKKAHHELLRLLDSTRADILASAKPCSDLQQKLLEDLRAVQAAATEAGSSCSIAVVLSRLDDLGYTVRLSSSHKGECSLKKSRHCLENLHHTFIRCTGHRDRPDLEEDVIVEPSLREQFEVAHPTVRYEAVLTVVPPVFVGPPRNLLSLIQLLCSEIALAFHEQGLSLPPWRRTSSVLSKWGLKSWSKNSPSPSSPAEEQPGRLVRTSSRSLPDERLLAADRGTDAAALGKPLCAGPGCDVTVRGDNAAALLARQQKTQRPSEQQGQPASQYPASLAAKPAGGSAASMIVQLCATSSTECRTTPVTAVQGQMPVAAGLLARGLAAGTHEDRKGGESEDGRVQRSPRWLALGLGHITTVRRMGAPVCIPSTRALEVPE